MKFAHMADCHIGSWRDPKLKDLSTLAFKKAIERCIYEGVDFILISGDLFNTSLPRIDNLKEVVSAFRRLKEKGIAAYIIPGSHDFSPSGKTMLDVLEEAGLFTNVVKGEEIDGKLKLHFTIDDKTGAKITGMLGRRNALEKGFYSQLMTTHLESEPGYKIFMFHSALDELKPKEMENVISQPLSLLPKGFDYYAGGHVHIVENRRLEGYGRIAYPGPLFPNSFSELEKLERGGFFIVENNEATWVPIQIFNIYKIEKDCQGKSPPQITEEILEEIKPREFNHTIVLLRLQGNLLSGKPTDIDFKQIFSLLYDKSAYFVMKNTSAIESEEFEEIKIDSKRVEDAESSIISEHLGQFKLRNMLTSQEEIFIKNLMHALGIERLEGENVSDFEKRLKDDASRILDVDLK